MTHGPSPSGAPPSAPSRAGTLVVVVPSIRDDHTRWEPLIARLQTLPGYAPGEADWARVRHGAGRLARGPASTYARTVGARIHERWVANEGYDRVVLVGHSLGGLLVRLAYLRALGAFKAADARPWAAAVDRIILFASLNRGIPPRFERRWWLPLAAWAARVVPGLRRWIVRDLLAGSEFITNIRITWIRAVNAMDHPPSVVQFLGSEDGLVHADDSRDIDAFPTGRQEEVAGADHADIIRLDRADDPDARFALFATAFTEPRSTTPVPELGDPAQTVVLVLHGIRADNRTWVADICRYIEQTWPGTVAVRATYGRFSARKFALPATRRRYLGWLQDTYAEQLAANPRATFQFIGHSNGTYLLGHSLDRVESMRFDRLFLAGSVLPTTYDWRARFRAGQVRQLRNDRSARDVPVGVLCSALRGLGMRDIGTGGVDGFLGFDDAAKLEVAYYAGGHSAALGPDNLARIARFVMQGVDQEPDGLARVQPTGFALLSRAAPWLGRLAAVGVVAAAAAFVAGGPWGVVTNALVAVAVAGVAFVVADLV